MRVTEPAQCDHYRVLELAFTAPNRQTKQADTTKKSSQKYKIPEIWKQVAKIKYLKLQTLNISHGELMDDQTRASILKNSYAILFKKTKIKCFSCTKHIISFCDFKQQRASRGKNCLFPLESQ